MAVAVHPPSSGFIERLVLFLRDIKLSHTVFALPFAVLAAFLAAAQNHRLPQVGELGLILLCMVFARTVAMAVNRWADANLDSLNPRTQNRAIPAGRLTPRFVLLAACLSAAGFAITTAGFWFFYDNVYPLALSPFVLAWLIAYSFTKRFTWWCHLFLGTALALSPLAAAIAIQPSYLSSSPPYLLAIMVTCWVSGFDVIYALQDVASDRQTGVLSLPSRLGVRTALAVSGVAHALAIVVLVAMWTTSTSLGHGFALGIIVVAVLLVLEHTLVWRSRLHHIHIAFFTINGIVSVLLGTLGIIDTFRTITT